MTDVQLYFAIGVPTFAVLGGIIAGVFQMTQLNARFTSLETVVNTRFGLVEQDLKALVKVTNELDVRLARLEERSAR